MEVIYARISTASQSVERQLSKRKKTFIDVISSSIAFAKRPAAKQLLNTPGITSIEVADVCRLGRDLGDIVATLKHFEDQKINLFFRDQNINTLMPDASPNPMARMFCHMLALVYQYQKDNNREKAQQGVNLRKARGDYKGKPRGSVMRPQILIDRYGAQISIANEKLALGQSLLSIQKFFNEIEGLKVSRQTLVKLQQAGLLREKHKA